MLKNAHAVASRPIRVSGGQGSRLHPLRMERRREDREPSVGIVSATYSGPGRFGITHLEIVDRSAGGLGARTRTQIEPGMTVTICPEGSTIPWLSGRATRCTPEGDGYRIGLVFDRRRAA